MEQAQERCRSTARRLPTADGTRPDFIGTSNTQAAPSEEAAPQTSRSNDVSPPILYLSSRSVGNVEGSAVSLAVAPSSTCTTQSRPRVNVDPSLQDLACSMLDFAGQDFPFQKALAEKYCDVAQVRIVPSLFAKLLLHSLADLFGRPSIDLHSSRRVNELAIQVMESTASSVASASDIEPRVYFERFIGQNLRWESLGIFFALVATVLILLPASDPLVSNRGDLAYLVERTVNASSSCIHLWRCYGTSSDLAAILTYQNLLVLSLHHGDTDVRVWRRLHDLSSIVFEMNLDKNGDNATVENHYLIEMRRRLFAAAYSIEQTFCAFFDKPAMTSRQICHTIMPLEIDELDWETNDSGRSSRPDELCTEDGWSRNGTLCVAIWIRLRYILATVREDLLGINLRAQHDQAAQQLR